MIRLARSLSLIGFALLTGSSASAQTTQQKTLSLDGAKTVADAAAAEARKHNAGGAIAIVDTGGHLLYLARLDKTFPAASAVAIEKARTAATFRRPTRDFENAIKNGRTSLLGVSVMTPLQGGVPIVVDGEIAGAIGVSGATSAQEDDDIASIAAGALGASPTASAQR
jgi:glc operon protein GlcG